MAFIESRIRDRLRQELRKNGEEGRTVILLGAEHELRIAPGGFEFLRVLGVLVARTPEKLPKCARPALVVLQLLRQLASR